MPGTSANSGNSLEPAPLESNWHFKINLCQQQSRSILQQSRVHSALAIRQLKIQGWARRPWLDPSAPHAPSPRPAFAASHRVGREEVGAAATTLAGLGDGAERERGRRRCRITPASALALAPWGLSEAALPTWLNLTPAAPKIASGIIHP